MNTQLTITGEQLVGKGIRMAADYVDTKMNKGTAAVQARPSTYINLAVGLGGVLISASKMNISPAMKQAALIIGSNVLAEKIPDYAVELASPTAFPKTSYGGVSTANVIRPTVTIQPSANAYRPVSSVSSAAGGFF
jgi:hypothetical protein